ncbi:MAG TPA: protein translocase subunit SecF [Clostridiales bacterium]|nr:protein translocase subunit SecF [Clostridiales bacterium]
MKFKMNDLRIISKRKIWYACSLVIILAGLVSFFIQGFNFGIDFTGGSYLQLTFYEAGAVTDGENGAADTETATADDETQAATDNVEGTKISMEDLRSVVNDYVSHTPTIQYDQTNQAYIIRTDINEKEDVDALLKAIKTEIGPFAVDRNEVIGPTIGRELTQKAIMALAIASVLMLIYITIRFQVYYGIASIITLVHDALIVLAVFSIFQLEISSSFVAAILTVIGYSINATIIVFDRVRENRPNYKQDDLEQLLDHSISQTVVRCVNTTLTVLMTLFALLIFGGDTTKIFVLAMIIGTIAGLYSSVCLSGSLYHDLFSHFGGKKNKANESGKKQKKEQTA